MSSPDDIAKAFVEQYYSMFSTAPQNMVNLYQPGSCLIWEGTRYDGQQAISEKLQQMGAQRLCFDTPKIDCCMSHNSNSLLIFVTSKLTIGGENALHFAQSFNLASTGPGQFYVHNDMFRLVYG